jgi:hypothetical protein
MDVSGFTLTDPPAWEPYNQTTSSDLTVLAADCLEHGAYYTGKLGSAPMVARWHAQRRRFVFVEYALGRQRTRSVAHIGGGGPGDRFAPLAKTNPSAAARLSDYAFETAS